MGLAILKESWQRQTRYFGHDRGEEYSVLVMDNRGIGESDKPLGRYSTSEMARDVIEVMDHVGWTGTQRELNVVGISLGGMIAQEMACLVPERIQSLSLLCTTAALANAKPLAAALTERAGLLVPKSEERAVADTARQIFPADFLAERDTEPLPSPRTTPRLGPAPGVADGEYLHFGSNFQRFQAQELAKRRAPGKFTKQGFLCQLLAAGWHRKSPDQLRGMADRVGRERIMVLHGTEDKVILVSNGLKLIELIEPGTEHIVEGLGHAPIMERAKWFNDMLAERLDYWGKLNSKI